MENWGFVRAQFTFLNTEGTEQTNSFNFTNASFQYNQLVIVHAKQLVENSLNLEGIPEGACWNFLKNNLITH